MAEWDYILSSLIFCACVCVCVCVCGLRCACGGGWSCVCLCVVNRAGAVHLLKDWETGVSAEPIVETCGLVGLFIE